MGPSELPERRVDFDLRRFERRSRRCHRRLIKKFYFQTFARRRSTNCVLISFDKNKHFLFYSGLIFNLFNFSHDTKFYICI